MSSVINYTKLTVGDIFQDKKNNSYEIVKELGKGGFAVTYSVNDKNGKSLVAKIHIINLDPEDEYRKRKQSHEGKILELLQSHNVPNIVKFEFLVECDVNKYNVPVLFMQHAPGMTCQEYQLNEPSGCFPEETVKKIILKIGEALQMIHKFGIIHRDIKPENIFLDGPLDNLTITLIDFGIASIYDQSIGLNKATIVGTHFYSPPEQLNNGIVSPSADIFALGATAFVLATGRTVDGDGRYNAKTYEKSGFPISQEFADVIIKATWPEMKERFPIMDDFLAIIQGNPPIHTIPRIIIDGNEYPIDKDKITIGRDHYNSVLDIIVSERSPPGKYYISRNHCHIEKDSNNYYRLYDDNSRNGTMWKNNNNEWKRIPKSGIILGSAPVVIGLGFSDQPTGKVDRFNKPILPGVYRVIEYRPSDQNTISP